MEENRELQLDETFNLDDVGTGEFKVLEPCLAKIELSKNPDRSGRYKGGEKMSACPIVKFQFKVTNALGEVATIFHDIHWHVKFKGEIAKISKAFSWIDQNNNVAIPWTNCIGDKGFAEIGIEEYKSKSGEHKKKNVIAKFYFKGTDEYANAANKFMTEQQQQGAQSGGDYQSQSQQTPQYTHQGTPPLTQTNNGFAVDDDLPF